MPEIQEELSNRIAQMQSQLVKIAINKGLNSRETILFSQKLDKLILDYQKKDSV
ncbi:Spo0E family sporulation regulatory protein-aspartic acid phosphatase [Peribacillus sp. B-H-3]|uniref:Spo0E family sporulation regulatory protein-aspartic acid phosphatase n=1 Tax=Peribacillus sp. B-H-3 TaxID=3400420 RepID=UPI003B02733C